MKHEKVKSAFKQVAKTLRGELTSMKKNMKKGWSPRGYK